MNTLPTGLMLCAVLILGLNIHVDCQRTSRPQQVPNLDVLKSLSLGMEKFSLTLLLRTALDTEFENFVICPLSVWTMLTVLSEGAKTDTLQQMSQVLRHPQDNRQLLRDAYRVIERAFIVNTSTVELAAVNSFFVDKNVRVINNYLNLLRNVYNTQINNMNFADPTAATSINDIIARETRGKIRKIVEAGDLRDSTMILTNAVYFRGQWELPFNTSLTKRETFYDSIGNPIGEVNLMYQRGPFAYANMPSFTAHVVELPYGRGGCSNFVDDTKNCANNDEERRLSMIVMIPYHKVPLLDVFKKFVQIPMADVLNALEEAASAYEDDEVDVYLPRFTIDTDYVLNKMLYNMGMQDVFDSQYSDLSGITDGRLFLSKVLHKAFIEVTEEGTIATAVTAGELTNRNTPPKFKANKPFLYFIYEKSTRIIVFAGNYNKPSLY